MNSQFLEQNLKSLNFQRNILITLSLIMSVSLAVLSFFLFTKQERIIVTPAIIEKEFWVEGNRISASYLEQFGLFIGQLLLSNSAQSASSQRTAILRHTDPAYINILRKRLLEEEEMLKKQSAAYVFFAEKILVDPQSMQVNLTGERQTYAGGKQVSSNKESYRLTFGYVGSQLLLKSVSANGGE